MEKFATWYASFGARMTPDGTFDKITQHVFGCIGEGIVSMVVEELGPASVRCLKGRSVSTMKQPGLWVVMSLSCLCKSLSAVP